MAHWVAEVGKWVFWNKSFSQNHNLGLHSQISWAVSKTLVGVLVWSLFMHFLLSITFRCFQLLFLIFFYLEPTYMSLSFNAENSSQGFSRTSCGWTELHIFSLKLHFTSAWFLHVISALYQFFGKINTLTSGLLLYSYACPWHMLELQPCAALGLQPFPLIEWCSVSPLAGASETYFFKHWWWWCWWHRADYKGPLGRTLVPEHSRALPAPSLSRAEVY